MWCVASTHVMCNICYMLPPTRRDCLRAAGALGAAGIWRAGFAAQGRPGGPPAPMADFAALGEPIDGRRLVYLDSAATTLRPAAVIDAIGDFYRHDNANPSPSMHALARRAARRYSDARATAAR